MKYTFKPSHIVPASLFVVAVLYGGSKPPMPTNPPPCCALGVGSIGRPKVASQSEVARAVRSPDRLSEMSSVDLSEVGKRSPDRLSEKSSVGLNSLAVDRADFCTSGQETASPLMLTNWTARGAYCDWQRIEFPPSFQFPVGTNFIDGVTLMSWGELRQLTANSQQLTALPQAVSLEPNFSSLTHGLTPSNSYLFAWHDCCANRSATNRVDASIELFDSGAVAATVTPLSTNQPPITIYQPPIPPEGFVGHGQNDAWLAASFPSHYAAITNLGYDAWLDDHIGHNEPNGRYKLSVTIAALPEHGPCYLFCGPYKMVVTSPGTYSFPLEVFEEYRAYTLPTRVPLSFEYDDGYDVEEDAPLMAGAPLMAPRSVPDYYIICMTPHVYVVPQHIPLSEAVGTRLNLLCNCPNGTWSYTSYFENHLRLTFGFPSYAEIQTAEVADRVTVIMRVAGHECSGVFFIDPPPSNDNPPPHNCCNACCGDDCRCDGTCCICSCGCHSDANSSTNSTEAGHPPFFETSN